LPVNGEQAVPETGRSSSCHRAALLRWRQEAGRGEDVAHVIVDHHEHLRRLLTFIRKRRGPWAKRAYAVGYFDAVRTRLLDKRNIQVINLERPTNALDSGLEAVMPDLLARAGIQ